MPRPEEYLRPDVIRQISRLDLKARFIVEGFLSGLHDSPFQGFSVEFSEHRKYVPGDDLKHIDWSVFARTNRFFIKKFQAETIVEAYLLMDLSESMIFGSPTTKFEYSIYLAASLAYMMTLQQDKVGLMFFNDEIRLFIPARNKRAHLTGMLTHLASAKPSGQTDLSLAMSKAVAMIKHRGLVIVFSDLLAEPDDIMEGIGRLRHAGHDVIVFHVLDTAERSFPYQDFARFTDPETGMSVMVDAKAARRSYLDALEGFMDDLRQRFAAQRIDYVPIDTSVSFDRALISFLSNRRNHAL